MYDQMEEGGVLLEPFPRSETLQRVEINDYCRRHDVTTALNRLFQMQRVGSAVLTRGVRRVDFLKKTSKIQPYIIYT